MGPRSNGEREREREIEGVKDDLGWGIYNYGNRLETYIHKHTYIHTYMCVCVYVCVVN